MRKFFNGLVMGILLSAAAFFFLGSKYIQQSEARSRLEADAKARAARAEMVTNTVSRYLKLDLLDLREDEIKTELKKNNEIIRRKPHDIGETGPGPDSDSNAVTEIKAKYQADIGLSPWDISVTCAHGHVALIGTVESLHDIGEAVAIALEPGGVRDVTSTLQPKTGGNDTQLTNQ